MSDFALKLSGIKRKVYEIEVQSILPEDSKVGLYGIIFVRAATSFFKYRLSVFTVIIFSDSDSGAMVNLRMP